MRKIVLMLLLTIAGCGDKGSASKTDSDAGSTHSTSLNSQFGAGPRTPEEKFSDLKRKAEAGDAKSQFGLARMYYNGDGVAKDDVKAAEWYLKTAEQGNDFAQYKLGAMYDKGEGVPRDADKAVEWWKKAAAQGNEAAQEALKQLASR
ncbi:MAG: tetratricopeptide repeat protein [Gallionella sp.]